MVHTGAVDGPCNDDAMTRVIIKNLLAFVIVGILAAVSARAADEPERRSGPVPGKYVVKLRPGVDPGALRRRLSKEDRMAPLTRVTPRRELRGSEVWSRYFVYQSGSGPQSQTEVTTLFGKDNVEHVEPDFLLELFSYPDDSLFEHQWYLLNTGQEYYGIDRVDGRYNDRLILKSGTAGKDIRLEVLYRDPPAETTRVVVAIVDTGIDSDHPQLAIRMWSNPDEIPGNGLDDDHNGLVDDTLGYDISGDEYDLFDPPGDNDPTDTHGHGTHLSGIVAAAEDGRGVVGVVPWAELMAVKIFPNATSAVGAAGIVYAVNAGAQAINVSWGSPFVSTVLEDALRFARQNGVFVAVAAGNFGTNDRYYPAACDSAFVVAAGNSDGFQTTWSSWGGHVDIVAPGQDMLSLRAAGTDMYEANYEPGVRIIGDDSAYYLADGTSMAAPVVVGVAALLRSLQPNLTLPDVENLLRFGATDLIDPWNEGDTLVGPDTVSGWGYLNVESTLQLFDEGGMYIIQPVLRNRYTSDLPIRIAALAGYTGSWRLDYRVGLVPDEWQTLASGAAPPVDSIAYTLTAADPQGNLYLRLTDQSGREHTISFIFVRERRAEITYPQDGDQLKYAVPIRGSVYGPDYDSLVVYARAVNAGPRRLLASSAECYDSLLYHWTASGSDTGHYVIYVFAYFGQDIAIDSVAVEVESAFASGWPQRYQGRGAITPVCCDLNRDGIKELALATSSGLYLWELRDGDAFLAEGYPASADHDLTCVPAIYDVDRDGDDEIIATSSDGIHVFTYEGDYASGWPQVCFTGRIPFGYSYPNPTVTRLGLAEDSAIVIINKIGQILAYEFNGDSYFFSMGGLFASLDPRISDSWAHGGGTSPLVTATDIDGDQLNEVVSTYTSPRPYVGLSLTDARTGRPAWGRAEHAVRRIAQPYGIGLADLDRDLRPEIVVLGFDYGFSPTLYVTTNGTEDLPGWPRALPERADWIASYPVAADLDLDGIPEILVTFFEYDIGSLYIFRADGTPYREREGRPAGEAFFDRVTFSTPMVANLLGDRYPEIIFRSGFILPGTGPERLYILDNKGEVVPGFPVDTPARSSSVMSSRYVPLVDDFDGDSLVELALVSDGGYLMVWDFEASWENGANTARFLNDNLNSAILPAPSPPLETGQ